MVFTHVARWPYWWTNECKMFAFIKIEFSYQRRDSLLYWCTYMAAVRHVKTIYCSIQAPRLIYKIQNNYEITCAFVYRTVSLMNKTIKCNILGYLFYLFTVSRSTCWKAHAQMVKSNALREPPKVEENTEIR